MCWVPIKESNICFSFGHSRSPGRPDSPHNRPFSRQQQQHTAVAAKRTTRNRQRKEHKSAASVPPSRKTQEQFHNRYDVEFDTEGNMYYGELWEEDGDFAWHDYVNETQWTTMWSDGTPYKRSQAMTWRPIMLSMGGLGAAACPAPGSSCT